MSTKLTITQRFAGVGYYNDLLWPRAAYKGVCWWKPSWNCFHISAARHNHDWRWQGKVWLPVTYSSKTKTAANKGYRKVEEGFLGILQGILEHRIYLYGTRFMLVADHMPLVALYSSHSRSLPMHVARHKSKVVCFDFDMIYELRAKNPAEYSSKNPMSSSIVSE